MPCKCIPSVFITLYRTPDSAEGVQAKQFLDRKGLAYEDLVASANAQAFQKMKTLSGQTERPVIVIDGQVYTGFDPAQLDPQIPSLFEFGRG